MSNEQMDVDAPPAEIYDLFNGNADVASYWWRKHPSFVNTLLWMRQHGYHTLGFGSYNFVMQHKLQPDIVQRILFPQSTPERTAQWVDNQNARLNTLLKGRNAVAVLHVLFANLRAVYHKWQPTPTNDVLHMQTMQYCSPIKKSATPSMVYAFKHNILMAIQAGLMATDLGNTAQLGVYHGTIVITDVDNCAYAPHDDYWLERVRAAGVYSTYTATCDDQYAKLPYGEKKVLRLYETLFSAAVAYCNLCIEVCHKRNRQIGNVSKQYLQTVLLHLSYSYTQPNRWARLVRVLEICDNECTQLGWPKESDFRRGSRQMFPPPHGLYHSTFASLREAYLPYMPSLDQRQLCSFVDLAVGYIGRPFA